MMVNGIWHGDDDHAHDYDDDYDNEKPPKISHDEARRALRELNRPDSEHARLVFEYIKQQENDE